MINLKNINYKYNNSNNNSLNNINLNINKGETILICGKSGCGKSTLLQTINGIIPELKEGQLTGELIINDINTSNYSVVNRSKIIGSVFQNPKTQFFHLNTTDEILFSASNHLMDKDDMYKRLEEIVKEFKIEHLINKNIFNLSGGEKQMIAIASISMTNPDIYILDEPSSNLDEISIEKIKYILNKLKQQGKTIIIAEHRLYYALDIADRVIYMDNGYIISDYNINEFKNINEETRKNMGLRSFNHKNISDLNIINNTTKYITLENMQVKYDNYLALNINKMNIDKNKIIAITGDNGAGKSTFVKAFSGLLKTKNALIDNEKLLFKTQQKNSFMVMQDVNNQLYCESAIDELVHMTDESQEIMKHAEQVLEKLNLLSQKDEHPMALSGGQKQRLAIATAIFMNKKYLIFDEPTSGLDYDNMIRVSNLLKELKDKVDIILVITHDSELIQNCCDSIINIKKGITYNT